MAIAEPQPFYFDGLAELVDLIAGRPAWQRDAACRGKGPSDWFPTRGRHQTAAIARARAICATCSVRAECEDFGGGQPGLWGGRTIKQRSPRRRPPAESAQAAQVAAPAAVEEPDGPPPPKYRAPAGGWGVKFSGSGRGASAAIYDPDCFTAGEWLRSAAGQHRDNSPVGLDD